MQLLCLGVHQPSKSYLNLIEILTFHNVLRTAKIVIPFLLQQGLVSVCTTQELLRIGLSGFAKPLRCRRLSSTPREQSVHWLHSLVRSPMFGLVKEWQAPSLAKVNGEDSKTKKVAIFMLTVLKEGNDWCLASHLQSFK